MSARPHHRALVQIDRFGCFTPGAALEQNDPLRCIAEFMRDRDARRSTPDDAHVAVQDGAVGQSPGIGDHDARAARMAATSASRMTIGALMSATLLRR